MNNLPSTQPPTPTQMLETVLVDTLLSAKAAAQHRQGSIGRDELEPFAEAIKELSGRYVGQQGALSVNDQQAAAYALYYLPINFSKLCFLLRRIPATTRIEDSPPLRILDYGSGPGTGALAALATLRGTMDITVLDREASMRSLADRLVFSYATNALSLIPGKLIKVTPANKLGTATYDLIIAANVLNELPASAALPLAKRLIQSLSPTGTLVLLEPALPQPTRALMKVRDELLSEFPALNLLFPCTHREPCPMLRQSKDDWCHGTLEGAGKDFEHLKLVSQLDALLRFNKHRIKYSAMLLSASSPSPEGYRAITDAEKTHRGSEIVLCGRDFFGNALLTKGATNDGNRHLRRVGSYELLRINPKASATLAKGTVIERVEEK